MIIPTVGRVVLVRNRHANRSGQPEAALIAFVHNDRLINVGGFDGNGLSFAMTSLRLVQEGDLVDDQSTYAEWMNYQKGQAAKTEAVESELAAVKRMATAGEPLIDVNRPR